MHHDDMPKNETELIDSGLKRLSGSELEELIGGKKFFGLYRPPFHYEISIGVDGALWGENNFGTQDNGSWFVDSATDGFTVSWQKYWDANTSFGYLVNGIIHLFDTQTGDWQTSLLREINEI